MANVTSGARPLVRSSKSANVSVPAVGFVTVSVSIRKLCPGAALHRKAFTLTASDASTGDALISNLDPSLSDTATAGSAVEDVSPPGGEGAVDVLASNRETAGLAVPAPHAASAEGDADRAATSAARTIAFL
jgi:hypothetical protein